MDSDCSIYLIIIHLNMDRHQQKNLLILVSSSIYSLNKLMWVDYWIKIIWKDMIFFIKSVILTIESWSVFYLFSCATCT